MRTFFVGIGVIAVLVGAVWTLQGMDILLGSFMSGSLLWLAIGMVLVIVGAASLVFGAASRRAERAA